MNPAHSPASSPRAGLSGLVLTGFALLVVLLAVVLVQARQFSLLRQAVQTSPEYSMVAVYQAEFEYQRLLQQWQAAVDDRRPLDGRALQLRYDIWVSRMGLLQSGEAGRLAASNADDRDTVEQALRFIARADLVLGSAPDTRQAGSRQPLTREFLLAELPQLRALGTPLHAMTLNGADHVARLAEERTQAVQQQNLLGLGLTVFLSLLTLAFAAAAMRLLKRGRERQLELEALMVQLRQAQKAAEGASAAKSEFLAHMSHEVRTPFHGLMGMLSLLRETGLGSQQQAYLRTATESADHLLAVLNDILDLSQLENGRLRLALVAVDVRTLLRDVEALVRPQAMARGLSFHVDIAPDVPELLRLDPMRVRQILFNLLSNAVKFTNKGAVALDVRVRQLHGHAQQSAGPQADPQAGPPAGQTTGQTPSPHDQTLEFCVTDTGEGLDAAALAALFERSLRGQARHLGHAAQGAGLGLEISRKLSRAMDGDLTARSQPGQGSSFTLMLPLRLAAPAGPGPAADPGSTARTASAPSTRSLHVLVAEDHAVNCQYMEAMLSRMGHRVAFAGDGETAVAMARQQIYDLVLMDLHLPALDGIAATRAIRALPDTARSTVPIVALTADAFETTRDRCLVAGMNGFLSKPMKPDLLASTLRRLFGSLTAPAAANPSAPAHASAALTAPGSGTAHAVDGPGSAGASSRTSSGSTGAAGITAQALAAGCDTLVDAAAVRLLLQTLSRQQYAQLAQVYFDQAPHTACRLRAAVRDGQPLDVRANAHAAKGAALNLGLAALAATAHALQQGAAHLPAHEIALLVQRLDEQTQATFNELQAQGLIPPQLHPPPHPQPPLQPNPPPHPHPVSAS